MTDLRPAGLSNLVRAEFPELKLYVRSFDRRHSLELVAKGVDYEMRETFESALEFGRASLEALGLTPERAVDVRDYVRKRDLERLGLQQVEAHHRWPRVDLCAHGPARTAVDAAA